VGGTARTGGPGVLVEPGRCRRETGQTFHLDAHYRGLGPAGAEREAPGGIQVPRFGDVLGPSEGVSFGDAEACSARAGRPPVLSGIVKQPVTGAGVSSTWRWGETRKLGRRRKQGDLQALHGPRAPTGPFLRLPTSEALPVWKNAAGYPRSFRWGSGGERQRCAGAGRGRGPPRADRWVLGKTGRACRWSQPGSPRYKLGSAGLGRKGDSSRRG